MSFIQLLHLTIISTPDDFDLLNTNPTESFALANDISLNFSANKISTFSGSLSGSRHEISIFHTVSDIVLFYSFLGSISDVKITRNQDTDTYRNQVFFQTADKAQLTNCFFTQILSSVHQEQWVSPLRVVYSSNFTNFTSVIKTNFTSGLGQLFGIAHTVGPGCTGRNIVINITGNSSINYFGGAAFTISSSLPARISIVQGEAAQHFHGYASASTVEIRDVQVEISSDSKVIYGLIGTSVVAVSGCRVVMRLRQVSGSLFQAGICYSCGKISNVEVYLFGNVQLNEKSIIRGVCFNCQIQNSIVYVDLVITSADLYFGGFSVNSGQIQNLVNSSFYIKLQITSNNDLWIGGIAADNSQITSLNLWVQVDYIQISGNPRVGGLVAESLNFQDSFKNTHMQFTFQSIKTQLMGTNTKIGALFSMNRKVYLENLTLLVDFEIITKNKFSCGVLGQSISNGVLTNIIIQIQKFELHSAEFITGVVAQYFNNGNLTNFVITGNVDVSGDFAGIIQTIKDSIISYGVMNLVIQSSGESSAMINSGSSSSISYVISYSESQNSTEPLILVPSKVTALEVHQLQGEGKNCDGGFCIAMNQLQDAEFAQNFIDTGEFVVDEFNFGTPYLKGFYSMHQNGTLEKNDLLEAPFGYDKAGNGIITTLSDICAGACHGNITPGNTVCDEGYSGEYCDQLDCSFCKNGACDGKQCECDGTHTGEFCEESLCNVCFPDQVCSPIAPDFVQCQGSCNETCINGDCIGDFCACHPGFETDQLPCDDFLCTTNLDCSNQICISGGVCDCQGVATDESCKDCVDDYIFTNGACLLLCDEGFCKFGNNCTWDDPTPIGDYTCESCKGMNTGDQCDGCIFNSEIYGFGCYQPCAECTSGSCYFPEQCLTESAIDCNYTCANCTAGISGPLCNECLDDFTFYEWDCRQNSDHNGTCFEVEDDYVCTECHEGFILFDKHCPLICSGENCINGVCQPDQTCLCDSGYQGDSCDQYNCSLDSGPSLCGGNGDCIKDVCECFPDFTISGIVCIACPTIYNGICSPTSIDCDPGFQPEDCLKFRCEDDTQCGDTPCDGGQCRCSDTLFQHLGYCLIPCRLSNVVEDQILQLSKPSGVFHGTIYLNNTSGSELIRNDTCLIFCSECRCSKKSCQCSPNVIFVETGGGKLCQGCIPPYTGAYCESCLDDFLMVSGVCFEQCTTCNGMCYFDDNGQKQCLACYPGYDGSQCDQCSEGNIQIDDSCFEICGECNGQCYRNGTINSCILCSDGYMLPDCTSCDTGFASVFGGCYKLCITCPQGECYDYSGEFVCLSCNGGLIGTQCSLCPDGFVMAEFACHPQIGTDSCYKNTTGDTTCVGCAEGRVLVGDKCYPRCTAPQCTGDCYLINNDYLCQSCYEGYILSGKCYAKVPNPNGDCYSVDGQTFCTCMLGFSGDLCHTCDGLSLNGACYLSTFSLTGDCYVNTHNSADTICLSCNPQYVLPYCDQCSLGYTKGPDGQCSKCSPGFSNSSSLPPIVQEAVGLDRCVAKCESCVQGNCWYSGIHLVCFDCAEGFTETCLRCSPDYHLVGTYCMTPSDPCLTNTAISENICLNCSETQMSFNCSACSLDWTFGTECKIHAPMDMGRCQLDNTTIFCNDFEVCLQKESESDICDICNSEMILINGSCWVTIPLQNNKYRGECFQSDKRFECSSCEEFWDGKTCNSCSDEATQCACAVGNAFTSCCCQMVPSSGLCYISADGTTLCNSCSGSSVFIDGGCQAVEDLSYLKWAIPLGIFILLIIISVIVVLSLSKERKGVIWIRFRKVGVKVGKRLFFVILAQVDSIIIAVQDVYINDFYMQAAVNLVSAIPFVLLFMFTSLPSLKNFQYNRRLDLIVFLGVAGIEMTFNLIAYFTVPEQLEVSQSIYKLASPPVVLLLVIFFSAFRFMPRQKLAIFAALALPIVFQMAYAISDATLPSFFAGTTGGKIVGGQLMMGIDIMVLGSQYFVTEIVLSRYAGYSAMVRLAFGIISMYLVVALIHPQEVIAAILDLKMFAICAITQIIFNVVNVIIMMNISVVEFAINTISSAIWVELIVAVGDKVLSEQNFIHTSSLNLVVVAISMLVVFVCLIAFNCYSNPFNERFNSEKEDGKKFKNGVHLILQSRQRNRKAFKRAKLAYNDYNINSAPQTEAMKQFVLNAKTQGINPHSQVSLQQNTTFIRSKQSFANRSSQQLGQINNSSVLLGLPNMSIQQVDTSRNYTPTARLMRFPTNLSMTNIHMPQQIPQRQPTFSPDTKISHMSKNISLANLPKYQVASEQIFNMDVMEGSYLQDQTQELAISDDSGK